MYTNQILILINNLKNAKSYGDCFIIFHHFL